MIKSWKDSFLLLQNYLTIHHLSAIARLIKSSMIGLLDTIILIEVVVGTIRIFILWSRSDIIDENKIKFYGEGHLFQSKRCQNYNLC